ncbi:hypothetical protein [Aureimonas sp. AU40]|uniref:hypothetical protein n=1 Tax=Aureimonas sp. AU40 TaxID=1637747 RepID=UPI0007867534|nr:hypothetical protein [Aureimonas sp. AU40]
MIGARPLAIGAALLALVAGSPLSAAPLLGVGTPNLGREKQAEISATLDAVERAGFQRIRLGWKPPYDGARSALAEAARRDVAVLVTLPLTGAETAREGTTARPARDGFFPAYGLSTLDPARVEAEAAALLQAVQESGAKLLGLELGNEMNWSGYNGDLALQPAGKGRVAADLGALSATEAEALRAGIALYADSARRVAARLAQSESAAPLLVGGLADVNDAYVRQRGATLLSPDAFRALLSEAGVFETVGAVGVHLYEPLRLKRGDEAERVALLEQDLKPCGTPAFAGRPCWLTEFGSAEPAEARCDRTDAERRALLQPVLRYLARPEQESRVKAAFWHDWEGDGAFSLVRCGVATTLANDLARALPSKALGPATAP